MKSGELWRILAKLWQKQRSESASLWVVVLFFFFSFFQQAGNVSTLARIKVQGYGQAL